jgi:hypothetical protein
MKKLLTTVVAAAALTASLVVAPVFAQSAPAAGKSSAGNTERYCFKERLYSSGGEMSCNWASSAAEACRDFTETTRIAASAMTEAPKKSTRCANGEWLVQVTLK